MDFPDLHVISRSVKNTLQVADSSLISAVLGFTAKVLFMPNRWNYPMFQKLNQVLYDSDFERNGRKSFQQHYDLVRSLVPPENLLEYHVSDGWAPLCKFLDKPIPSEEIPFMNQTSGFKQKFRNRNMANIKAQLKRVLDISAYAGLAVSAVSVLITQLPWRATMTWAPQSLSSTSPLLESPL